MHYARFAPHGLWHVCEDCRKPVPTYGSPRRCALCGGLVVNALPEWRDEALGRAPAIGRSVGRLVVGFAAAGLLIAGTGILVGLVTTLIYFLVAGR